ncbi:hypothetical protein BWI96_20890 [Siphonobacter sp. SORGH_AS_0500]|uniref:helix-turn-helix transcriptional regulator n=1 Tax=Siphonobacter sp. SORGH_AS_0500 TaxID=1864824 RepID=UPI000CACAAB5|nr:helix-turn-helix transcriptional regulator [Siphonobacter sp. SORGH_AS_0500]PKK34686.1 hypothetical protein BWI96_20890 [Siphonobacter sp. SORGH_AS_0500]
MKSIEAQRVIELRGNKTQEEFASLIGTDRGSISFIENGTRSLSLKNAKKICEVFNVSLDWLFGYTEIMSKSDETTKELAEKNEIIDNLRRELDICNSKNEMLKEMIKG